MEMNARIALFGTSRSGKDYNIADALKITGGVPRHISPIGLVHEELNGRKLKDMPPDEKVSMMSRVHARISQERTAGGIITDEHCCFPAEYGGKRISNGYVDEKLPYTEVTDAVSGKTYEVVMDTTDAATVTAAIYLMPPAETVLERFRISEGCKRNDDITLADVTDWQSFEVRYLSEFFRQHEIPFSVLHGRDVGRELAEMLTE